MKPVVVNPLITFEQLLKEVVEGKEQEFREESLRELVAKLQRKKRVLSGEREERFETAAGMPVKELLTFLKCTPLANVADSLTKSAKCDARLLLGLPSLNAIGRSRAGQWIVPVEVSHGYSSWAPPLASAGCARSRASTTSKAACHT